MTFTDKLLMLLIGVTLLFCGLLVEDKNASAFDPFDQRNFPCMEDEVLAFVWSPTGDRTACIHWDTIENSVIEKYYKLEHGQ